MSTTESTAASARTQLRFLLIFSHHGMIRNFEGVVRELAARGHRVHMTFDSFEGDRVVEDLQEVPEALRVAIVAKEHENLVTYDAALPKRGKDCWFAASAAVRAAADFVHLLHPAFVAAPELRGRTGTQLSPSVRRVLRALVGRSPRRCDLVFRALAALDRAVPVPEVLDRLAHHAPDLVVVSPLVGLSSLQVDHVRWARRRGFSTALPVASWDNLSTKGRLLEIPDRVIVWNERQRDEALELQRVPGDRLAVTGAPVFDSWFETAPSTSHDKIKGRLGLDRRLPYFLYVMSSPFIAPDEILFAERWVKRLREHPGLGAELVGIAVRPHPLSELADHEDAVERLLSLPNVGLHPRSPVNPIDGPTRGEYYDMMVHASAVVGINTTAMLEGGVVGIPVHTILAPEYRKTQTGTLHFDHLRVQNGGSVHIAASWLEHIEGLVAALGAQSTKEHPERGPSAEHLAQRERFVATFVRPRGADRRAAAVLADELEAAARLSVPAPAGASPLEPLLRAVARRIGEASLASFAAGPRESRVTAARWAARGTALAAAASALELAGRRSPLRRPVVGILRRAMRHERTRRLLVESIAEQLDRPGQEWLYGIARKERKYLEQCRIERAGARDAVAGRLEKEQRRRRADQRDDSLPAASQSTDTPVKVFRDHIAELVASGRPIVAGPWLGGATFELLAWIPILRWLVQTHRGAADRLVVVSRGGTDAWYQGVNAVRHVDVLDLISYPRELVLLDCLESESEGQPKSLEPSALERELCAAARQLLVLGEAVVLSPSALFQTYHRERKLDALGRFTKMGEYIQLAAPADHVPAGLAPGGYVVVGLAFDDTLVETSETLSAIADLVRRIADGQTVVVLGSEECLQALHDGAPGDVIRATDVLDGRDTAARVSSLVANAAAVVANVGSLSALGVLHGTTTVAIHSDGAKVEPWVVERLAALGSAPEFGAFAVCDLSIGREGVERALRSIAGATARVAS